MNKFISRIFRPKMVLPGFRVLRSFIRHFGRPFNVEWHKSDDVIEAIFFHKNKEQIARFTKDGTLTERQVNLSLSGIPLELSAEAEKVGEIMSVVYIKKGEEILYEVIVRDKDLRRYLIVYTEGLHIIKRAEL